MPAAAVELLVWALAKLIDIGFTTVDPIAIRHYFSHRTGQAACAASF
jgi:hypothetical protein